MPTPPSSSTDAAIPASDTATTDLLKQLLQSIRQIHVDIDKLRESNQQTREQMLKETSKTSEQFAKLEASIADRDKEMTKETSKTREDFAKLEMRIADREKNMTRWIVASFVATIVVISGILSIFQFGFPS